MSDLEFIIGTYLDTTTKKMPTAQAFRQCTQGHRPPRSEAGADFCSKCGSNITWVTETVLKYPRWLEPLIGTGYTDNFFDIYLEEGNKLIVTANPFTADYGIYESLDVHFKGPVLSMPTPTEVHTLMGNFVSKYFTEIKLLRESEYVVDLTVKFGILRIEW